MSRGMKFYEQMDERKAEYKKVRTCLLAVIECSKVEPVDRLRAAELLVEIDKAEAKNGYFGRV